MATLKSVVRAFLVVTALTPGARAQVVTPPPSAGSGEVEPVPASRPESAPVETPSSVPWGLEIDPVPPSGEPVAEGSRDEPFGVLWRAPAGEAPPLPMPVVLSVGAPFRPRLSVGDFAFDPHLRIRLRGAWVQEDPNYYFVGRTSGFNLGQARLGLSGSFRQSVRFSLSLEGAADRRAAQNQLVGELSTRLRDAFVTFSPWSFIQVTAGQFRPPRDRETLTSYDMAPGWPRAETLQLLPEMSVGNRGVQAGEGLQVAGLDGGRELGVMLHGDIHPLPFVGGTYALALVNGNGENQVLNDNNEPFLFARLTGGFRRLPVLSLLDFGTSFWVGRTTTITALPNEFTDQVMGGEVDAVLTLMGLEFMAEVMWQQTRHFTTNAPSELALAGLLQVAYRDFFGVSPVARAAYYQASSALPQFTVAELTAGVRYDIPNVPLSVTFCFTHPEETGWGIYNWGNGGKPNDSRVPSLVQVPAAIRDPVKGPNWAPDRRDGVPLANERVEGMIQLTF